MIKTNHRTGLEHWSYVQTAHLEFPPTGKAHIWWLDVNVTLALTLYYREGVWETSQIQLRELIQQIGKFLKNANCSKMMRIKRIVKSIIAKRSSSRHDISSSHDSSIGSGSWPTNIGLHRVSNVSGFHLFFHGWERGRGLERGGGGYGLLKKRQPHVLWRKLATKIQDSGSPQCSWSCLGASPQTWSSAKPDDLISFRCSTASTLVFFCRISNSSFNIGNNRISVHEPNMNILLMCRVDPELNTVGFHDPACFCNTTVAPTGLLFL